MSIYQKVFGTFSDRELKKIAPIVKKVLALESTMQAKSDDELKNMTPMFKLRLSKGETLDSILPEAFAVCREAAWRVLRMKHHPVQIIGGIVLHRGYIAEMCTGEGKTLVATLPVYLNALTGEGVHVVTVNDYLAKRDSEEMGKLYRWLGLTVGLVIHDTFQRKQEYLADVTYGTNNEFGFDYLRDNMASDISEVVQRGYNFAIIDEVDSILIDEARTPLIISGGGVDRSQMYYAANQFALTLKMSKVKEIDEKIDQDMQVDGDCLIDEKRKTVSLTASGVAKAEAFFGIENLMGSENVALVHYIDQAIRAVGVMRKDVDYIVKDGEIVIVDEFTGRLMDGRRYNEGLHQAIEAKEGVKIAADNQTLASVTFQNYFRMYKKLSGMTGTASTEADEFNEIYGLPIVAIPTNRPIRRIDQKDVVYKTENGKYKAIVEEIVKRHQKGQPVLVGTTNVEKSELLSIMLNKEGIPHHVLNAKQHAMEAEIVAQAGKKGSVTIATNMAGRGTDIKLGGNLEYAVKAQLRKEGLSEEAIVEADGHGETTDPDIEAARRRYAELEAELRAVVEAEANEVRSLGGLYVIASERSENRRIDNQLRGRSGRQGDPGESRFFLSLEDDLLRLFGGERAASLMNSMDVREDEPIASKIISNAVENAQKKLERRNFDIRKNVISYDDVMDVQRKAIYSERMATLQNQDLSMKFDMMLRHTAEIITDFYCKGENSRDWSIDGLKEHCRGWLCDANDFDKMPVMTKEKIQEALYQHGKSTLQKKERDFGYPLLQKAERMILLNTLDHMWKCHMEDVEQLQKVISLRSYGQHDPVIAFRLECFDMFDLMIGHIHEIAIHTAMNVEVR